ncbi:MAG: UbiD family decarboxylase [bacterium]
MSFLDLRTFIRCLEQRGELVRVKAEVDPDQDITIIQHRVLAANGPALLFEKVKGSPYRVVSNLFGTAARVTCVFGRPPADIGAELAALAEALMPPTGSAVWKNRKALFRLWAARMRKVRSGPILDETHAPPQLTRLPCLTCWPLDGGPFLTLPLVHTVDPETGRGNLGIYRMQRYDDTSTGMHWQIEKGGGVHFQKACRMGRPLPISVFLGGPPALTLAAIAPLPEGVDERLLAALIMGRPLDVISRATTGHRIPATAEFVLEGCVVAGDERREGPFGDHLGHYSHSADFPVYRVSRMLARKDAIYPATVVGKPPQEDFYIGNALQELCVPLLKQVRPGIGDLWSYAETGFHPLAVMSVCQRYEREALKFVLGVLGEGQLSLTKIMIAVDSDVGVRDFRAVSRSLREHFDPADGLHLLAPTAQDTLDFSGPSMNVGSRLILLANRGSRSPLRPAPPPPPPPADVHGDILALRALGEGVLMAQVSRAWRRAAVVQALQEHPVTRQYVFQVAVSDDVPLHDDRLALWGWFTRFDPLTDLYPAQREQVGNRLILHVPILFDATWKEGYRQPVAFDPIKEQRVTDSWSRYGLPRLA